MATDFSSILSCTVGGSSFQLVDYTWSESAIVANGIQGRRIVVKGMGWIQSTSHALQASGLRAAETSFRTSGQNLTITGPGGVVLEQLLAANCVDGGPHFDFEVEGGLQDGFGARHVNFTASAQTSPDPDSGQSQSSTQRKVSAGADELPAYSWSGELTGPDVEKDFGDLLDEFRATFALPSFVVTHEFTRNEKNDKGSYQLTAKQTVDDLPSAGTATVVDGRASFDVDRDEQMQLVKRWQFDLVVDGDPQLIVDQLRPKGTILSESVSVGHYDSRRLRVVFVTLEGGDGNALMNWQASLEQQTTPPVYDAHGYPGAAPILVRRPDAFGRLAFSGTATGCGIFIDPPKPPSDLHLEPPVITRTRVNAVEFRTDWRYVTAVDPGGKVELGEMLKALDRPKDVPKSPLEPPKFEEQPKLPTGGGA